MLPIVWLILYLIFIYKWIIIASVVLSWLVGFNVVNGHNPIVKQIRYALMRLTEPVLAPIRRILPDLGAIDISPLVVFIILQFLEIALPSWLYPLMR